MSLALHIDGQVGDLWDNVTAHMWACRYGVAFFEDRVDRGLNHNLLIEVGAMIMSDRRANREVAHRLRRNDL